MVTDDLKKALFSADDLEVLGALMDLTALSKEDVVLPPDIIERVRLLLTYRHPETSDTELQGTAEDIRWQAVSLLGVFLRLGSSFDELSSLLKSNRDTEYVLTGIAAAIAALGTGTDLQREALRVLAATVLDSSYPQGTRETAYVEVMCLAGKISRREWAGMQNGLMPIPDFDEQWLRSLI